MRAKVRVRTVENRTVRQRDSTYKNKIIFQRGCRKVAVRTLYALNVDGRPMNKGPIKTPWGV
jgi:hypothetical protein